MPSISDLSLPRTVPAWCASVPKKQTLKQKNREVSALFQAIAQLEQEIQQHSTELATLFQDYDQLPLFYDLDQHLETIRSDDMLCRTVPKLKALPQESLTHKLNAIRACFLKIALLKNVSIDYLSKKDRKLRTASFLNLMVRSTPEMRQHLSALKQMFKRYRISLHQNPHLAAQIQQHPQADMLKQSILQFNRALWTQFHSLLYKSVLRPYKQIALDLIYNSTAYRQKASSAAKSRVLSASVPAQSPSSACPAVSASHANTIPEASSAAETLPAEPAVLLPEGIESLDNLSEKSADDTEETERAIAEDMLLA